MEVKEERERTATGRVLSWTLWKMAMPLALAILLLQMLKMGRVAWLQGFGTSILGHMQVGFILAGLTSFAYEWTAYVRRGNALAEKLAHLFVKASRTAHKPKPRTKAPTLAMVMAEEFEASVSRLIFLLSSVLLGLTLAGLLWRDRSLTVVACGVGALILVAHARQGMLRWRIERGYFGSSEHEVRELLRFASQHPRPTDFFDGGGLLPAFEIGERKEQSKLWAAPGEAEVTP